MTTEASERFFYVKDEDPTRHFPTLERAKADAEETIRIYREACDPEWPWGVEDIAVFECDAETDEPSEDGRCVLVSTMINHRAATEDDQPGVDSFCDYAMLPPSDAKARGA